MKLVLFSSRRVVLAVGLNVIRPVFAQYARRGKELTNAKVEERMANIEEKCPIREDNERRRAPF